MPWPASPPNSEDIETLQILWLGHLEQFFQFVQFKIKYKSCSHRSCVIFRGVGKSCCRSHVLNSIPKNLPIFMLQSQYASFQPNVP